MAEVRKALGEGGDQRQAVDDAIDICIEKGVLSCTEKQYDRLVRKELEQQEKRIKEQERLLELNRILVRERKYDLLEQIQDDPALCEELMVQYGV